MPFMAPIMKIVRLMIISALCAINIAGCTYRQPGIEERDAATINGYFLKYRANFFFPHFWPEGVKIIAGDDEETLREHIREYLKNSAYKAHVAPGYRCIVVQIQPVFGIVHTCPICFNVEASQTYQARVHWEYRWPELYGIEYVDVVEESSGRIVAKQQDFCKGPLCCLDCSECPVKQSPNLDATD
jgi:hypothetical protein